MGVLEKGQRKRAKKANLKRAILASVKVAGFLAVAAMAPNALRCLVDLGFIPKKRHKESLSQSCNRLIESGMLESKNGLLRITSRGEAELRRFELSGMLEGDPNSWDGKWRVLIFDISEKKKDSS